VVAQVKAVCPNNDQAGGLKELLAHVVRPMLHPLTVVLAVKLSDEPSINIEKVRNAKEIASSVENGLIDQRAWEPSLLDVEHAEP
jgi:hypothetical protein